MKQINKNRCTKEEKGKFKMFFFKSSSGAVHEESQPAEEVKRGGGACVSLTVWRKSLLLTCNGFTVIDRNGNIVYRVDNYVERPEEMILMDGLGKSVLTMCRSMVSQFLLSDEIDLIVCYLP